MEEENLKKDERTMKVLSQQELSMDADDHEDHNDDDDKDNENNVNNNGGGGSN